MAGHNRDGHEFGVPDENLSIVYEGMGGRETTQRPAPELYNLKWQLASEEQKAARRKAIAEEIAENWDIRTEWERNFSFGAVVKPETDTLRGYKFKLRENNGANGIQFSPQNYPIFDNVIIHQCGGYDSKGVPICPAFNPASEAYDDFAPLRRNIAILRNYLLVSMYPDGEYKPAEHSRDGKEDRENNLKIQQMALRLGKALNGHGLIKPVLPLRFLHTIGNLLAGKSLATPDVSDFMAKANVPDTGVVVMYDYLFDLQSRPSFWDSLPFVQSARSWNLLPRDKTPFSDSNMLAFSTSALLEETVNRFEAVTTELSSVDKMSEQDRVVSVEQARIILEKLRILLGNPAIGAELSEITDTNQATAFMLLRSASTFEDSIAQIAMADPNLLRNPVLEQSFEAIEQINYQLKVEAEKALLKEGRTAAAAAMGKRRAATPNKFKNTAPIHDLVPKLQVGLNETAQIKSTLPAKSTSRQQSRAPSVAAPAAHPPSANQQMVMQQFQQAAQKKARRDIEIAAAKAAAKAASKAHGTISNARVTQANDPMLVKAVAQKYNEPPSPQPQKEYPLAPGQIPGKSI